MPEIVRNLAIAGFLCRLGTLIWLDKFSLAFDSEICDNNQEQTIKTAFKSNYENRL